MHVCIHGETSICAAHISVRALSFVHVNLERDGLSISRRWRYHRVVFADQAVLLQVGPIASRYCQFRRAKNCRYYVNLYWKVNSVAYPFRTGPEIKPLLHVSFDFIFIVYVVEVHSTECGTVTCCFGRWYKKKIFWLLLRNFY